MQCINQLDHTFMLEVGDISRSPLGCLTDSSADDLPLLSLRIHAFLINLSSANDFCHSLRACSESTREVLLLPTRVEDRSYRGW